VEAWVKGLNPGPRFGKQTTDLGNFEIGLSGSAPVIMSGNTEALHVCLTVSYLINNNDCPDLSATLASIVCVHIRSIHFSMRGTLLSIRVPG
jgi:hypothetical protein